MAENTCAGQSAAPENPTLTDSLLGNYREQMKKEAAAPDAVSPTSPPPVKKGWARFH